MEAYRVNSDRDHPHFGREQFDLAEAHLKRSRNSVFTERYELNLTIGNEATKLGENRRAVEALGSALELQPQMGATKRQENELLLQLAIGWLRVAEAENCIECGNCESCIFPIRGEGLHGKRNGSQQAIVCLNRLLKLDADHLVARWLLVLAHQTLGSSAEALPAKFRLPKTAQTGPSFPRFRNVASDAKLDEVSLAGSVIADDFDNDELLDLVVSNWHSNGQLRFFRNRGDGTFEDRTKAAGLIGLYAGLNLVQADYDNDGDLDVLVLRGAWQDGESPVPNSLLQNDGKGHFVEALYSAGLGEKHYPTQTACWFDYDLDGDLDLYIGNEKSPCQLFQNDGKGKFVDVAKQAGVRGGGWVKGVSNGDFDGDGDPDLYVSNLTGDNQLYRNNGDGTFSDVARELGVTSPRVGFPTWFWDFNNDGVLDIFAASYDGKVDDIAAGYFYPKKSTTAELDCLYQGDGKGGFRNVAADMGLRRVTLPMGANFGDLDNDGFLDFYLATGNWEFYGLMPNLMFHNIEGKRFNDVTTPGGFGHLQKGHGVAFFDYDNDGDQDVFNELGGAYKGDVFQNALFANPGFSNNWIKIRLVGKQTNRYGMGARIRVEVASSSGDRSLYRWVDNGSSFGANPLRQEIGLGKAERIKQIEVWWPVSKKRQTFDDIAVNQLIEIHEGEQQYRRIELPSLRNGESPK